MKNGLFKALKGIALFLKAILWLPMWMFFQALLTGGCSWQDLLLPWLVLELTGFLAVFLVQKASGQGESHWGKAERVGNDGTWYISRELGKGDWLKILVYVAGVPVCGGLAVLLWSNRFVFIPAAVLLYLNWIRYIRHSSGAYTDIFSYKEYIFNGIWYLIFIGVSLLMQFSLSLWPEDSPYKFAFSFDIRILLFAFMVLTVFTGILLNQSNIDILMERRRHDKTALPQRIRVYNLMLVGGLCLVLCLVLVVCIVYQEAILSFLIEGGRSLARGIIYLIEIIFWLIEKLFRGATDEEATTDLTPSPGETPVIAGGEKSVFWDYLTYAVIVLVVILFIRKFPVIWKKIQEVFSKLWQKLMGFLLRSFNASMADISEYYSDDVESLSDARQEDVQENPGLLRRRGLKKALRQWKKLTDPTEKFRKGYRIFMDTAAVNQQPFSPADTAREQLQKLRQSPLQELGDEVAQNLPAYEAVRYGEQPPAPEQLEQLALSLKRTVK